VPVLGGDVANAYRRLNAIIARNNVRRELSKTARHEKRGDKRRRLASQQWRTRFSHEVCSYTSSKDYSGANLCLGSEEGAIGTSYSPSVWLELFAVTYLPIIHLLRLAHAFTECALRSISYVRYQSYPLFAIVTVIDLAEHCPDSLCLFCVSSPLKL
jgi:hypothetical protein